MLGYLKNLMALQSSAPDDVAIIPGHGPLATKADLDEMIKMFKACIDSVERQLQAGKSLEQVLAKGVPEHYKDWGWRFISEERWLKTLHSDLSK